MGRSRKISVSCRRLAVATTAALLTFAAVPTALASLPSCTDHALYDTKQVSLDGDYVEITSGITDPSASTLPGSDLNDDNGDHILLWDGIVEESVPVGDQCGDGSYSKCWLQAGVGMGLVSSSLGSDYNGTKSYELTPSYSARVAPITCTSLTAYPLTRTAPSRFSSSIAVLTIPSMPMSWTPAGILIS